MPDQITTADMSQHWRIIDATGSDDSHRIHAKRKAQRRAA